MPMNYRQSRSRAIGASDDEARRTSALALWRYSHDYLKVAQSLCENDQVACNESQVPYHLAMQGVEFGLKSYLRAKGVTADDLSARIGHSLLEAFQEALARGLPTPPSDVVQTLQDFAPFLRDDRFNYLPAEYGEMPELAPLLDAGLWILWEVAAIAAADYHAYVRPGLPAEVEAMTSRLYADLHHTASKMCRSQ